MKSKGQIEILYSFVGFFNDGKFMNQDYRAGIQDALAFVLYDNCKLEKLLKNLKNHP